MGLQNERYKTEVMQSEYFKGYKDGVKEGLVQALSITQIPCDTINKMIEALLKGQE